MPSQNQKKCFTHPIVQWKINQTISNIQWVYLTKNLHFYNLESSLLCKLFRNKCLNVASSNNISKLYPVCLINKSGLNGLWCHSWWRMFVCMKCINQYGAMKYILKHKPTTQSLEFILVFEWQLIMNDPLEQVWTKVGMEVGSIYTHGRNLIGCDSSPPNPWTPCVHSCRNPC